jgi:hypothetical protein
MSDGNILPKVSSLLAVVICVSVVFQILGVPLSFGNLGGASDLIEASQLEGFSLISTFCGPTPIVRILISLPSGQWTYHCLSTKSIFHPPLPVL